MKSCPSCGRRYPPTERFCSRDGAELAAAATDGPRADRIVGERYRILRELSAGGSARVYLAEHVRTQRKVALKMLGGDSAPHGGVLGRLQDEALVAGRLSHPHIAATYDAGETEDGELYLAMEFVEGEPLSALLDREGTLRPARAARITHAVAGALQAAHDAGIVHRDLKPANIMLGRTRDGAEWPKLVDFGIATMAGLDDRALAASGLALGTPDYMSPEQLASEPLDGRSDTYALALVAFRMLAGTLPFESASSRDALLARTSGPPRRLDEVRPGIPWPDRLQQLFDSALARRPEERYQSALAFADDLLQAIAPMDEAGAIPVSTPEQLGRVRTLDVLTVPAPARAARSWRPAMLLAIGFTVVTAGAAVAWRVVAPAAADAAAAEGPPPVLPDSAVALQPSVEATGAAADSATSGDSTSTAPAISADSALAPRDLMPAPTAERRSGKPAPQRPVTRSAKPTSRPARTRPSSAPRLTTPAGSPEAPIAVRFRITLWPGQGGTFPIAEFILVGPAGDTTRFRNNAGGVANVQLPPGAYLLRSATALRLRDVLFRWQLPVPVTRGMPVVELNGGNAVVDPSPVQRTPRPRPPA